MPAITKIIYLIGFAGVGKYTVAKEIETYGYQLVDNHLINNPIFSLATFKKNELLPPVAIRPYIDKIRSSVLEFIENDRTSSYVFTNALYEDPYDHQIYDAIQNTAMARGSIFIPIKLLIHSEKEHKKRLTNPARAARFKPTHWSDERIQKGLIQINHTNLLNIDVTDINAKKAAHDIIRYVETYPKPSR